jgi:hypothetical protein
VRVGVPEPVEVDEIALEPGGQLTRTAELDDLHGSPELADLRQAVGGGMEEIRAFADLG